MLDSVLALVEASLYLTHPPKVDPKFTGIFEKQGCSSDGSTLCSQGVNQILVFIFHHLEETNLALGKPIVIKEVGGINEKSFFESQVCDYSRLLELR